MDRTPHRKGKGERELNSSRRGFLACAGGLMAAAGAAAAIESPGAAHASAAAAGIADAPHGKHAVEPFFGAHQSGILTPAQSHTYFAAFDVASNKKSDLVELFKTWTAAAARMTLGYPALKIAADTSVAAPDSGDSLDMPPSRLTITFGFGPELFLKDGKDRFSLAKYHPEPLVDLPHFNGDQFIAGRTGGDLSIQACADDPQVAFHAVRQLSHLAYGVTQIRWVQAGFVASPGGGKTPRNLMGFKDGTNNPSITDAAQMAKFIWVGNEGPEWLRGGSYVVTRRIRIALEHWDRTPVDFQEEVIGRHKYSGAPVGKKHEFDIPDLNATDKDGNPIIADTSHLRLATAVSNDGAKILRRGYSYNDGVNFTAERWPPWRQGMEYDSGLLFVAYQRDPRTGFIKIFEKMSKLDMLNQFTTHTGSALFACPPGASEGGFIGQALFDAA
jgi:deferrochelatase/peroxidase EfeB